RLSGGREMTRETLALIQRGDNAWMESLALFRETREAVRLLQECSADGICLLEDLHEFRSWLDRTRRIHGVDDRRESVAPQPIDHPPPAETPTGVPPPPS